ncbi:MAG: DUF3105 domain-containing protein [Candidatus Bipolaricaulia bacterium]
MSKSINILIWIFILVWGLWLPAVADEVELTDEEQIIELFDRLERAFQTRSLILFMSTISKAYHDESGLGYKELKLEIAAAFSDEGTSIPETSEGTLNVTLTPEIFYLDEQKAGVRVIAQFGDEPEEELEIFAVVKEKAEWKILTVGAQSVMDLGIPVSEEGSPPEGARETEALQAISVPIQGFQHIGQGQSHPPYNSVPATSGWHYPFTAPWGVHTEPIPDELQVHNLEHGGVIIQYRLGIADSIVDELRSFTERHCRLIIAPYPGLDRNIALTAWGQIDKFDEFDHDRIEAFIEAFINQGPERIPCP